MSIINWKVSIAFLLLLASCHKQTATSPQNIDYSKIAGTWKAEEGSWQITISKDGKIESAIHPLGEILIKPNKTIYEEMLDGSQSSYTGGDFTLNYDFEKRELEVEIKVEKIHIRFLDNEIKGKSKATMLGFVSADFKTWNADVIEENDYGPRFPQSDIPNPVPTKFHKISD